MHTLTVTYQNILWLDVSVNNIPFLEVDQCLNHLRYHEFSLPLLKLLLTPESLKEVAALTILQHSVNILLVVKVAVESHNIGVIESPLDFQLFFHLTEKIKFLQSGLHHHL